MSTRIEKRLRAQSTAPERRLWRLLHPLRTGDYHFRKQEQIGPFYVDFACHHAKLVIEVDGETHYADGRRERDARRDEFLRAEGYTVLRFTNDEVMQGADGVLRVVSDTLESRPKRNRRGPPPPSLPHEGGGEEAASPPDQPTVRV